MDKSQTIRYMWRIASDYWGKFSVYFEVYGKAKDGDWVIVFRKKTTLDKEVDKMVNKFVEECREEFKKKANIEPVWGVWE
ncbi:MAG: hypothetical protein ACXQTS_02600 [Candidatus Methanospirareceae archaeon]